MSSHWFNHIPLSYSLVDSNEGYLPLKMLLSSACSDRSRRCMSNLSFSRPHDQKKMSEMHPARNIDSFTAFPSVWLRSQANTFAYWWRVRDLFHRKDEWTVWRWKHEDGGRREAIWSTCVNESRTNGKAKEEKRKIRHDQRKREGETDRQSKTWSKYRFWSIYRDENDGEKTGWWRWRTDQQSLFYLCWSLWD